MSYSNIQNETQTPMTTNTNSQSLQERTNLAEAQYIQQNKLPDTTSVDGQIVRGMNNPKGVAQAYFRLGEGVRKELFGADNLQKLDEVMGDFYLHYPFRCCQRSRQWFRSTV